MRPKKRILLIDGDECRQSLVSFRLSTWGYAVFSAASAAEGRALFESCVPCVIIAASDLPELAWLLKTLYDRNPRIPQMVLVSTKGECNAIADMVLYNPTPENFLERVKVISARRRGPHFAKPPMSEGRTQAERALMRGHVENVLGVEMPDRRTA